MSNVCCLGVIVYTLQRLLWKGMSSQGQSWLAERGIDLGQHKDTFRRRLAYTQKVRVTTMTDCCSAYRLYSNDLENASLFLFLCRRHCFMLTIWLRWKSFKNNYTSSHKDSCRRKPIFCTEMGPQRDRLKPLFRWPQDWKMLFNVENALSYAQGKEKPRVIIWTWRQTYWKRVRK